MDRLIISKQLEQAVGANYTVETDGSGNLQFISSSTFVTSHQTSLVVTTDGNSTGVSQSGTSDHTVDITLLSTVGGNALSLGVDGGLYYAGAGSFDISDGGTSQTIASGNTLLFSAGDGISAVVSATDTLTISRREVVEEFSVTSADGSSITVIGTLPASEDLIRIFRNGMAVRDGDWSLLGNDITFTESFGGSTNGTDSENILIRYSEG